MSSMTAIQKGSDSRETCLTKRSSVAYLQDMQNQNVKLFLADLGSPSVQVCKKTPVFFHAVNRRTAWSSREAEGQFATVLLKGHLLPFPIELIRTTTLVIDLERLWRGTTKQCKRGQSETAPLCV